MNILQPRKSIENRLELLAESLLGVFDLSSIETYLAKEDFLSATISNLYIYATITGANKKLELGHHHTSNTANFESSSNLGWKLPLSATQNNVQEFLARRHRSDLIAVEKNHNQFDCHHGGVFLNHLEGTRYE